MAIYMKLDIGEFRFFEFQLHVYTLSLNSS